MIIDKCKKIIKCIAGKNNGSNEEIYEWVLFSLKNKLKIEFPSNVNVMTVQDTIKTFANNPKTIIRYGDGEFQLINGSSIPFQKKSNKLARKLKDILRDSNNDFYLCVPDYKNFNFLKNNSQKIWYYRNNYHYFKQVETLCNIDRTYLNSYFNLLYMNFMVEDKIDEYYFKLINVLNEKKIYYFCGKDVFGGLKYNLFNKIKCDLKIFECPKKNSFSMYKKIMKFCSKIDKNIVLCFAIGPASKVLCYDLNKIGFLCLDFGHLLEDYNEYKSNTDRTQKSVQSFFNKI